MYLVRIEQGDAAGARQVVDAAIAIALGAGFEHGDHMAVMHVRDETVLDEARGQQLEPVQIVTGAEPVSYTHLDVYKRQWCCCRHS